MSEDRGELFLGLLLACFVAGVVSGYVVGARDSRALASRREVAAICAARCAPAASVVGRDGACGCAR